METYQIPEEELEEQFVRASGAGGQHVNKVSTAVQLRWHVDGSSLPQHVKDRFRQEWGGKLTISGEIVIEASTHRSQVRNRQDARKRLKDMLDKALQPRKKRIATRPGAAAVRKRLTAKKKKADVKKGRGRVRQDPD